jgi:hypothetical protein
VYSCWSGAIVWRQDRLSARDLDVGQYEQGAQERGGVTDVQAELGEDAPVLQVGHPKSAVKYVHAAHPDKALPQIR